MQNLKVFASLLCFLALGAIFAAPTVAQSTNSQTPDRALNTSNRANSHVGRVKSINGTLIVIQFDDGQRIHINSSKGLLGAWNLIEGMNVLVEDGVIVDVGYSPLSPLN